MGGDNTYAYVRTGEMILNAGQQRSLWEKLNMGQAQAHGAWASMNVNVNNSASNLVSAQPVLNKDRLDLYITARVNEGLKQGKFDQALRYQSSQENGAFYGI